MDCVAVEGTPRDDELPLLWWRPTWAAHCHDLIRMFDQVPWPAMFDKDLGRVLDVPICRGMIVLRYRMRRETSML